MIPIMMKIRILIFTVALSMISLTIGWLFWEQEVKYALPTPIPTNFVDIEIRQTIDLSNYIEINQGKNTLLHFFSDNCACSRFNMKEFERLAKKYEDDIDFFVVIQSDKQEDLEEFKSDYELDILTILDKDGSISDICGIYATPQAVIIDEQSKLYYKGNYNKARFCTRKETRFVQVALDNLLQGEELPPYVELAVTQPYGCTLPSDEEYHTANTQSLFSFLN